MLKTRAGELLGNLPSELQLLRRPQVEAKTARGRSAIYEGMARGIFPPAVARGAKGVAWVNHELDHLIEIEIKARDLGLRGRARDDFIRAELAQIIAGGIAPRDNGKKGGRS